MKCRYDKTTEDYLRADGEPCRTDDYGDPTNHCTARRTCSVHIGAGELTCPRCIGRTRADLAWIVNLAQLMPTEALGRGINSEAANLAGPAADPEAWAWRKAAAKQGRSWHVSLVEDDDERHPYLLLGGYDMRIREDYGHPSDEPVTIANAAAYLDRQLHRIANDPTQDWPLFSREIRACRNHMESVLHNGPVAERGAPCPACTSDDQGVGPRLVRQYAHWCADDACTQQFHFTDDQADCWVCPKDREHWWTQQGYVELLEKRKAS